MIHDWLNTNISSVTHLVYKLMTRKNNKTLFKNGKKNRAHHFCIKLLLWSTSYTLTFDVSHVDQILTSAFIWFKNRHMFILIIMISIKTESNGRKRIWALEVKMYIWSIRLIILLWKNLTNKMIETLWIEHTWD